MVKLIAPLLNKIGTYRASLRGIGVVTLAAVGLAGCAFTQNSDISNPVVRKSAWFSYLNADDLRTACSAGDAEGRIRVIYNADYYDEVRVFELDPKSGNQQFDLTTRVFGPAQVKEINVEISAPLGAFGGQAATDVIGYDDYIAVTDALQKDGFGTQTGRDGIRLYSDDYYWVALGCSSGYVTLGTWMSGVDDLRALDFPNVLTGLSSIERKLPVPPAKDKARSQSAAQMNAVQNNESGTFYRTVRGNMLR
ncbi:MULTISPECIES: hypothetical protein [Thalassospira]|uniref:Lipoprotein n=2 Tax=Thalassospira TaxID=168934 RepID=A0A367W4E3_9PROT|nr:MULTISPECIES: hypothetical protein [Thalassospira]MDG4721280.1 hypothetical protein [Thalassospira sp. FZY0004]RCK33621.1 hypothetical protein TH19_17075 [Thalassospira profundimaris]